MLYSSKIKMLSGVVIVICALSACTMPKPLADLFGSDRTLPDNDKVDFSNRHSPVLNPGGAGGNTGPSSMAKPDGTSARNAPLQNGSPLADNTVSAANVNAPVAATPAAPVADNASVVASNSDYPVLASVPQAPPHTPKAQSDAELNSLNAQREIAESSRTELMNDQSATVMTSPQTGQMIDNNAAQPPVAATPADISASAPAAVPAAPAELAQKTPEKETGFSNWVHNLFSSKPANTTSQAAVTPAPAQQPVETVAAEQPVPAAAPVQAASAAPVQEKSFWSRMNPFSSADNTPAQPPAPQPVQQAEAAPAKDSGFLSSINPFSSSDKPVVVASVRKTPVENMEATAQPVSPDMTPVTPSANPEAPAPVAMPAPVTADNNPAPSPFAVMDSQPPAPAIQASAQPAPEAAPVESAPVQAAPVQNLASIQPAPIVPQPEPVAPPAQTLASAQPAPMAPQPEPVAAPVQAQAEMEPVHLHPPVTSQAAGDPSLPDAPMQTASLTPEAPIHLTAPKAAITPASQMHYLADSRYAERRVRDDNYSSSY